MTRPCIAVAYAAPVAAPSARPPPVPHPLVPLDEAQRLVLARVRPLAAEPVPVERAAGRVLAEDARAVVDLPPFPSSAMDGFALRAEDTPGRLPVAFRI